MKQTRNNYDLGVMNGAMGIVTHVGASNLLVVEFNLPARRMLEKRTKVDRQVVLTHFQSHLDRLGWDLVMGDMGFLVLS